MCLLDAVREPALFTTHTFSIKRRSNDQEDTDFDKHVGDCS